MVLPIAGRCRRPNIGRPLYCNDISRRRRRQLFFANKKIRPTLKKVWTDFSFHATIRSIKTIDEVGTSEQGGGSMKIVLKQIIRKIGRAKIDWNFWLQVGTFLATLYGALK